MAAIICHTRLVLGNIADAIYFFMPMLNQPCQPSLIEKVMHARYCLAAIMKFMVMLIQQFY